MSSAYGHLTGRLTLTIAGNAIDLGGVQVPVTESPGFSRGEHVNGVIDRGQLNLSANTQEVADTVRELFAQSSAPESGGDGDE